ncbi:hypothetical protein [Chlorella virus XW01]|nr:hypothetical protein [Chlorella virus XW01]
MSVNLDDVTLHKEEIKMDNFVNFVGMLIKPNEISNFDFNSSTYLEDIFKNNHEMFEIEPEKFMENIGTKLQVNNYKIENKVNTVKNNVFFQDKNYLYEIIFIDLDKQFQTTDNVNELASLINIEGDQIYGSAVILKTWVPLESLEMKFVDVKLEDIINILAIRKEPLAVILEDGEYYEQRIGDLDLFALKFFSEEYYDKKELGIIHHNLNIWYTKSDFGEKLTNIVNVKVDKCIFFSFQFQNYRCDITIDEVKKLIKMAEKNIFNVDEKILEDETDNLGRIINKNKFRILNMMYNNIK